MKKEENGIINNPRRQGKETNGQIENRVVGLNHSNDYIKCKWSKAPNYKVSHWINEPRPICCYKKATVNIKTKVWERTYHDNANQKKNRMVILISEK